MVYTVPPPGNHGYIMLFIGSHVSDVTARYDSQWCTCTLKSRVGVAWWAESLRSYAPPIDEQELEEEDIMG